MISIVDHDPAWQDGFDALRTTYLVTVGSPPALRIEHVGSTAIEGLPAKPVIDVDIVVAPADVGVASEALSSIGFRALGERGITGRWAFEQPEGLTRTHTYVVEDGCLALRNHLAVRDVLRSDAALRAEYGELKRALASSGADMGAYVEGKSAMLRRILEHAGFNEAELYEIERANRAR